MSNDSKKQNEEVLPVYNTAPELKPVFALDDTKNVVIRFLDRDGNIVRQYPPEEYINMMKKLNEMIENLYSKKV